LDLWEEVVVVVVVVVAAAAAVAVLVVVVVGSSGSSRAIMNILMSWYSPNRPEAIHVWWERKYS
jgi:hypothetical protein